MQRMNLDEIQGYAALGDYLAFLPPSEFYQVTFAIWQQLTEAERIALGLPEHVTGKRRKRRTAAWEKARALATQQLGREAWHFLT